MIQTRAFMVARACWVLLLLAGCDTVFGLSRDGTRVNGTVDLLGTSVATTSATSNVLSIPRTSELQDGDIAVVEIHVYLDFSKPVLAPILTSFPDGWTTFVDADYDRNDCSLPDPQDGWHTWFLVGQVHGEDPFVFTFATPGVYTGLLAAYDDAGPPQLVVVNKPKAEQGDYVVHFDMTSSAPKSMMLIGGVTTQTWGPPPTGMIQHGQIGKLVLFGRSIEADGVVPAVDLSLVGYECVRLIQIRVEPR